MTQEGTPAQFFDGLTAGRHDVTVALTDDRMSLLIQGPTLTETVRWRLQDLRALRDSSDDARLTLTRFATTDDEAPLDPGRLIILDPDLIAWMRKTRPALFKRDVRPGTGKAILKYAGGAIAAAGLMLFVILPAMANTMAKIIPVEREIAFGKTVTRQMERVLSRSRFADLRCTDPEGEAALQAMLARLTDGQNMAYKVNLQVFDHEMVNAFAAPGGQVVILRGLLDEAHHPDEVAGVLAHEIGHVEARDATRHALRAAGSAGLLTMFLGDFTGGAAIAILGEHMISATYTRDAESAADDFALNMLEQANVNAAGLAQFFDLVQKIQGELGIELPAYLSTHPETADRAVLAREVAQTQRNTNPVLTDTQWQALKTICD